MKNTVAAETLRRFARRLQIALDSVGAPAFALDRARFLGIAIELDPGLASTFLQGLAMPDWVVFGRLCQITKRQPGYFLDEVIDDLPPVRVVKPLTTGENIVIRSPTDDPTGKLSAVANAWRYFVVKREIGFGVLPGDRLILCSPSKGGVWVVAGWLYLRWSAGKFEILRCLDVHDRRSTFSSASDDHQGISNILPLDGSGQHIAAEYLHDPAVEYMGAVVMVIRQAEALH